MGFDGDLIAFHCSILVGVSVVTLPTSWGLSPTIMPISPTDWVELQAQGGPLTTPPHPKWNWGLQLRLMNKVAHISYIPEICDLTQKSMSTGTSIIRSTSMANDLGPALPTDLGRWFQPASTPKTEPLGIICSHFYPFLCWTWNTWNHEPAIACFSSKDQAFIIHRITAAALCFLTAVRPLLAASVASSSHIAGMTCLRSDLWTALDHLLVTNSVGYLGWVGLFGGFNEPRWFCLFSGRAGTVGRPHIT